MVVHLIRSRLCPNSKIREAFHSPHELGLALTTSAPQLPVHPLNSSVMTGRVLSLSLNVMVGARIVQTEVMRARKPVELNSKVK